MPDFTNTKLEKDLTEDYGKWLKDPQPQTTGALIQRLQPTLQKGIQMFARDKDDAVTRGHAKLEAIKAIKSYNPELSQLSTHVLTHLQRLRRVSRKRGQVMRMPEQVAFNRWTVNEATRELEERLGRAPTIDELSDHTGLSNKRIRYLEQFQAGLSEGQQGALTADGEPNAPSVLQPHTRDIALRGVYDDLGPRQQLIMAHRLGLFGYSQLSNQAIAKKLNISAGAVSQQAAKIQSQIEQLREALEPG